MNKRVNKESVIRPWMREVEEIENENELLVFAIACHQNDIGLGGIWVDTNERIEYDAYYARMDVETFIETVNSLVSKKLIKIWKDQPVEGYSNKDCLALTVKTLIKYHPTRDIFDFDEFENAYESDYLYRIYSNQNQTYNG